MTSWKLAAIATLSAATTVLSGTALAQQTLADYAREGKRDIVLAAITSPDVDVDQAERDGTTALHWAVYAVDHEMVRALLDAGATADVSNRFGSTPLTEAVKLGDPELVRMLLDAGADPDSPNHDNQTALMLASSIGSLEIARLLIERGADVNAIETFRNQNALMWAAGENHPEIVDLLLANGANVDLDRRAAHDDWPRQMTSEPRAQFRQTGGLTALLYATRSGCYRCAVSLVAAGADVDRPNPDGITPLLNAIDSRHFDIAMHLIDQGAKVDVWDMHGRTPIYMAVDMNSFRPGGFGGRGGGGGSDGQDGAPSTESSVKAIDVARRLLDMGVDVNHELTRMRPNGPGRGRFQDYMMRGGTGPLMVAALSHDHESIALLLEHGAEVDLPNAFRITPLMAAAGMSGTTRNGGGRGGAGAEIEAAAIKTIDLLLNAGASINAQVVDSHTNTAMQDSYIPGADNEGKTALHAAAANGWASVVSYLLERGADPAIEDAHGNTALDLASRAGGAGGRPGGPGQGRGGEAAAGSDAAEVLRAAASSASNSN